MSESESRAVVSLGDLCVLERVLAKAIDESWGLGNDATLHPVDRARLFRVLGKVREAERTMDDHS